MQGPPDTPYEDGVFELYCQFDKDYPVKPPTIRFFTHVSSFDYNAPFIYWYYRWEIANKQGKYSLSVTSS